MHEPGLLVVIVLVVVFLRGKTEIQGGQHGENISLQQSHQHFDYEMAKLSPNESGPPTQLLNINISPIRLIITTCPAVMFA